MSTQPTADQLYDALSGDKVQQDRPKKKGRHRMTRAEMRAAKKDRKGSVPAGVDPARHSREYVEREGALKLIGASQD